MNHPTGYNLAQRHGVSVTRRVNTPTSETNEVDARFALYTALSRPEAAPLLEQLAAASRDGGATEMLEASASIFAHIDPQLPQGWEAVLVPF